MEVNDCAYFNLLLMNKIGYEWIIFVMDLFVYIVFNCVSHEICWAINLIIFFLFSILNKINKYLVYCVRLLLTQLSRCSAPANQKVDCHILYGMYFVKLNIHNFLHRMNIYFQYALTLQNSNKHPYKIHIFIFDFIIKYID